MDLDAMIAQATRPVTQKPNPASSPGGQDLDALISSALAHPAEPAGNRRPSAPGALETFAAVHGQNATLGLGDRLGGEFQTSLQEASDTLSGHHRASAWAGAPKEVLAALASAVSPGTGDIIARHLRGGEYADQANQITAENTSRRQAGAAANPWAAGAANVTGQVFNPANLLALGPLSGLARATTARLAPAAGPGLLRALGRFGANRAGQALVGGTLAGGSTAVNTLNETGSPTEALKRGASAIPLGLVAGAAPFLAGSAIAASGLATDDKQEQANRVLGGLALATGGAASRASELPGALRAKSISMGRRVLTGGADLASATKEPLSDVVVEEALRSKAIAPLGTTAGAAERLGATQDQVFGQYQGIIEQLAQKGVRGPEAAQIADAWLKRAVEESSTSLSNQSVPNLFMDQAEAIARQGGQDGTLGLRQSLDMTRKLQKEAKYGKYEETPLNEAKREQASDLRAAVEDAVTRQGDLAPEAAAQFEPVKARFSRLIQASNAAEKAAGQASKRNAFSPRDTVLAAAELAHTGPVGAAKMAVGSHVLRTRLPSTVAWGGYKAANLLDALGSEKLRPPAPALAAPALSNVHELFGPRFTPAMAADNADPKMVKALAMASVLRNREAAP